MDVKSPSVASAVGKNGRWVGVRCSSYLCARMGLGATIAEDWKGAVDWYLRAIDASGKKKEEVGSYYYELGTAYQALGNYEGAVDAFSHYLAYFPTCAFGYASRAFALKTLNYNEAAESDFAQYHTFRKVGDPSKPASTVAAAASAATSAQDEFDRFPAGELERERTMGMMGALDNNWLRRRWNGLLDVHVLTHKFNNLRARRYLLLKRRHSELKKEYDKLAQRLQARDQMADRAICLICISKQRSVVFYCRHAVCCSSCAPKLNTCPICQLKIQHPLSTTFFLS